jgi:hypothetical protein
MSLAERLITPPKTVARCKFASWIDTLNKEDAAAVKRALTDQNWPITPLMKVLLADGCPVREGRVRDHRRGECLTCGPL